MGSGAWELAGASGYAAVALEVRAGENGLILLSRGRPVTFQEDRGVRKLGMMMLGSD